MSFGYQEVFICTKNSRYTQLVLILIITLWHVIQLTGLRVKLTMCVWSRIRISFVSFLPSSNTRLYYTLRLTIRLIKICATAKVIEGYSTHGDNAAVSGLNVKEDCLYRLTGFIMCQFQFQNFKSVIETRSKLVNIIDNRQYYA